MIATAPGIWPNLDGQQLLYRFLEAGLPVTDDDQVARERLVHRGADRATIDLVPSGTVLASQRG